VIGDLLRLLVVLMVRRPEGQPEENTVRGAAPPPPASSPDQEPRLLAIAAAKVGPFDSSSAVLTGERDLQARLAGAVQNPVVGTESVR
jgi:hypothetical protein